MGRNVGWAMPTSQTNKSTGIGGCIGNGEVANDFKFFGGISCGRILEVDAMTENVD